MLRDRLEAMLMLTLWHLRALLTFVLALAIVVGSIVGIYRLAGHYRKQSDETASAEVDKEVASNLTHSPFDEFLSTRGVNGLIDGINRMRLDRTRRSSVMAHRLYNLDCQLAAAHRILELERTEEQQRFAIVAILRALSAREVTTMEEGFIDEPRYQELKTNAARFLDHSNLQIRQAAQIAQIVIGIREMCADTEPGRG